MAQMPTKRMGPPPGASPPMRMTASWSGSERTYRIQVCGAKRCALMASSPRINTRLGARQTLELRRKARLPVHRPSACSGVKALRNTSLATAASRQAPLAFRSLDPFRALRGPDCRRRDEKRPFPLRTKNCQTNPKQPLDRKSPIQVYDEPVPGRASPKCSARAAPAAATSSGRTDLSTL
jgi:hypothetical protein